MRNIFLLLAFLCCLVSEARAQSTTILPQYQVTPGVNASVSTTTPLPVSVYDLGNNTGDCYTSNSLGVAATFQPCGSGGVSSFSGGTTGLTPATATTGAVTLGGVLAVSNGGTGNGAFTQGSVVFDGAGNVLSQNNANFFWDNTNLRLGIGTASPAAALDVFGGIDIKELNAISFPTGDTTLGNSIAIGNGAMSGIGTSSAAFQSVAIGENALHGALTASGTQNTAVGAISLASDTSGAFNVAVGRGALNANSAGSDNTGIGVGALKISTSANNTALGDGALSSVTTGGNNLGIGNFVGSVTIGSGQNNILIGNNNGVDTPLSSTSNFLNIGNLIFGTGIVSSGTTPGGQLGIGTAAPVGSSALTINGVTAFTGTAPTCGTGCASITASSTNARGSMVSGSSVSSITLNFATSGAGQYSTTPLCTISDSNSTAVSDISAVSSTALTVSLASALSAVTIYYICQQ